MAPGGSTRGNSQEELGQGEEDSAKPIVTCSSPDKQADAHGVKFIEAIDDDEEEENPDDPDEEKDPPGKSNLENFKYYTSLFLGTLCLVSFYLKSLHFVILKVPMAEHHRDCSIHIERECPFCPTACMTSQMSAFYSNYHAPF